MDNLLTYVLPVLVVGYLFYNIFKLIIYRRLDRERRDYEALIESKLKELEQDIKDRSRDLQDSMQMINQEYSRLMKSMSLQQKDHAEYLSKRMDDLKKSDHGPVSPSDSTDPSDSNQPSDSDSDA
tara:strand:+ start:114 stop:488 length:375 start_codon:yes stop_codon:yes gene_type:complete